MAPTLSDFPHRNRYFKDYLEFLPPLFLVLVEVDGHPCPSYFFSYSYRLSQTL